MIHPPFSSSVFSVVVPFPSALAEKVLPPRKVRKADSLFTEDWGLENEGLAMAAFKKLSRKGVTDLIERLLILEGERLRADP